MKVETEIEITKETEDLPAGEEKDVVVQPTPEELALARTRELELEKARLEGENAALKSKPDPVAAPDKYAVIWADMNAFSEEEFLNKYKVAKHQASTAILQEQFKNSDTQTKQHMAELKADNQLAAKYPGYHEHRDAVDEALADLAPEVRQDPARLAKAMERAYLASLKDAPKGPEKINKGEGVHKRVIEGFEKPTNKATDEGKDKKKGSDEVPEEFRKLAKVFDITSESERKKLMESDFCHMDLGGGVSFSDPEKGFERVA